MRRLCPAWTVPLSHASGGARLVGCSENNSKPDIKNLGFLNRGVVIQSHGHGQNCVGRNVQSKRRGKLKKVLRNSGI